MAGVIIGHSQVKYVKNYIECDSITSLCHPGYTVEDFIDEWLLYEIVPSYSVIVIVAGANDVGKSSPDIVVRNLAALCEKMHFANTSATVVISGILPRGQNGFDGKALTEQVLHDFNADAAMINNALKKRAKDVPWLKYLEIKEFGTKDSENRALLSRDGFHLSYEGVKTLSQYLESICKAEFPATKVVHNICNTVDSPTTKSFTRVTIAVSTMKLPQLQNSAVILQNRFEGLEIETIPIPSAHPENHNAANSMSQSKNSKKCKQNVFLVETEEKFYLSVDRTIQSGGNGDEEAPVYSKTDTLITYNDAVDILLYPQSDSISYTPPYQPSAGSVYVYDDNGDSSKKEDWRCDGYVWRNYGKRVVTCGDHTVEKTFFRIKNGEKVSDQFQKHSFRFTEGYNNKTIIVYLGNDCEYKPLPHGNRKKNTRPYKRTMPSVLKNIKSMDLDDKKPKKVKTDMELAASQSKCKEGIAYPRNPKQVENIKTKLKKEGKLSHDSLYSLHLLVDQLNGYILEIKTTPDLQVIVGLPDIFEELNRLLLLKDEIIEVYYDTTFCLGDFYLSTIAFQHIMFADKPCIPAGFVLHERKLQHCHEDFLNIIKKKGSKT